MEERRIWEDWRLLLKAAVAEAMGAFFINLIACGAALASNNYGYTMYKDYPDTGVFNYSGSYQSLVSIAFGLVWCMNVALFQDLSGSHHNPAITLGMMASRNIPWSQGLLYIPAQFVGSLVGSAVLLALIPKMNHRSDLFVPKVYKKHGLNVFFGIPWMLILSAQLMMVYLEARGDTLTAHKTAAPIVIGVSVMINHLVGLYACGGCINPAQSLGAAIVSVDFEDVWVFVVFPPIGSVLGSMLHYTCMKPEPEEVEKFASRVEAVRRSRASAGKSV